MRICSLSLVLLSAFPAHGTFSRAADKYLERFERPCFESDKPAETQRQHNALGKNVIENKKLNNGLQRLVRLNGVKSGHVQEINLGESFNHTLITRALKPLLFEIPDFLSSKECDHIIKLAKNSGLKSSVAGFDQRVYDGDLEKDLASIDQNAPTPAQFTYLKSFSTWDRNDDGIIDTKEENSVCSVKMRGHAGGNVLFRQHGRRVIKVHGRRRGSFSSRDREIEYLTAKYALLHFKEDEIEEMFQQIGFHGFQNGKITRDSLKSLKIAKLVKYLDFTKTKHPRYRARFSDQTWLTKSTREGDDVLSRLSERVLKLTKLPRDIIETSEDLQVVHYGPVGHYHVHYDSTPISDETRSKPCCQNRRSDCRLCRFITILYYLNDVEEGGETAFVVADNATLNTKSLLKVTSTTIEDYLNLSVNCHRANLVVAPRKGHAIMWYNHFIDEDTGLLGEADEYSLHGGCDVIKGEKWIANNWLTAPPPGP